MNSPEEKKVYVAPEITFETNLEVRAGSGGGCGDGLNLFEVPDDGC